MVGKSRGLAQSGSLPGMGVGISNVDSMRQFNYYGQMSNANDLEGPFNEDDLEGLEREIEQVMRAGTAQGG